MRPLLAAALVVLLVAPASSPSVDAAGSKATVSHGISMYGDLKYPPGFKHLEYVNPKAPKGGDVKLAAIDRKSVV